MKKIILILIFCFLATPSFAATRKTVAFTDSNITGTAANVSGTPALPNGTTATTQSASDNSTKLATTAYADAAGGGGLCFGEIYGHEVNDEITITASGIANKVQITSFATNGVYNNTSVDYTNHHITITKAGVYKASYSISCESASGGTADTFGFSLFKNDGATELECSHLNRQMAGGGGDVGAISATALITCAVNDTIEVWVWNNTSTSNIVIDDICLNVTQIGG